MRSTSLVMSPMVKTRIPPERSHVCFRQLRTCRCREPKTVNLPEGPIIPASRSGS
jgi:hypothetical protein